MKSSVAELEEAKLIVAKYQAEVDRWNTEVNRLTREVIAAWWIPRCF